MLDFISKNIVKLVKIVFIKNFFAKMKKLVFLLYIFEFFELILGAVLFDYSEIVAMVKMRAVIEKETALSVNCGL